MSTAWDGRIPKHILYGEKHWPPRCKDVVKRDIDIDTESLESLADDHSKFEGELEKSSEERGREAFEYFSRKASTQKVE